MVERGGDKMSPFIKPPLDQSIAFPFPSGEASQRSEDYSREKGNTPAQLDRTIRGETRSTLQNHTITPPMYHHRLWCERKEGLGTLLGFLERVHTTNHLRWGGFFLQEHTKGCRRKQHSQRLPALALFPITPWLS